MVDQRNAMLFEQRLVGDAGKLEQFGRIDRAGRQDDFPRGKALLHLAVFTEGDAGRSFSVVEENFLDKRMAPDRQLRSAQRRPEIGSAAGIAQPVAGVDVIYAGAFERGAVE